MKKKHSHKDFEKKWYKNWESNNSFKNDVKSKKIPYVIMMPPPNVTGTLHIGHALTFTLQDILIRYHRMNDYDVLWQPGTDHAGIATQMVVERELNKKNISRKDLGREKFLDKVWEWKNISGNAITDQLKALGASPNWSRERFTMDEGLSNAVRTVFIKLYNEGLIYKDKRLVNWDTILQTAISDLEVEQREVDSKFWYINYQIENSEEFLTVATTRPETILGDTAVAVHPSDLRYKHLIGKNVILPILNKKIPIIADNYSDPEKGTGVVKITPAHDFNDFEVGKRHKLDVINVFTSNGYINNNVDSEFVGLERFVAREKIVKKLKDLNLLIKVENIKNTIPYGDRSNSIIEPWLMDQWYVNAKALAAPAIKSVKSGETKFVPKNWDKTFFEWMNNIQPWCISRQLWWGHRIPAWYGPDNKIFVAYDENEANTQAHNYYGKETILKQDEDVLDTWFSSALWPFSTLGWPEKTDEVNKYYPSNVLVTGFDIIFFWVARMIMMGSKFMNNLSPFKEVYIHALVRDEKGQKMSKSKGNVLDPLDLINEFGADPLRFTLAAMAAQGRDIKLSKDRINGYKNFSTKILNACNFLNINNCFYKNFNDSNLISLDVNKWIINLCDDLNSNIKKSIENYRFNDYCDSLYQFVWRDYCDWYIELIKPIFNSDNVNHQIETRFVAKFIMEKILKFLHPVMPFVTEECYEYFFASKKYLITCPWPKNSNKKYGNTCIPLLIDIASSIRTIRSDRKITYKEKLNLNIKINDSIIEKNIKSVIYLIRDICKIDKIIFIENTKEFNKNLIVITLDKVTLGLETFSTNSKVEIEKLKKDLLNFEKELEKIEVILSNISFVKKAPKKIVDQTVKKKEECILKITEIKNVMEKIK